MIYFKNSQKNVFAYSKTDIAQTERLSELEILIQTKEPEFIQANNKQQDALDELNEAKEKLAVIIFNENNDIETENNEEIQSLTLDIKEKETKLEEAKSEFNKIASEYQPLKDEYDALLPIFFDVREHLKELKKMTDDEVDAYTNPPKPKEQHIAEAEQQKQILLSEATEAIAPLQDAVDLDIATDEEIALLREWKKYRVLLNRVDTALAPDITLPSKP
ncbi:tail fiber assembly protein [Providencia rettgeri]|uniref:tail fiber assembly protein n=1 Tax=Providencia rettgeri TaxID=587 RepID=UPI00249E2DD6|nr:tail fiber assembly protein [Providencia rettgeri]